MAPTIRARYCTIPSVRSGPQPKRCRRASARRQEGRRAALAGHLHPLRAGHLPQVTTESLPGFAPRRRCAPARCAPAEKGSRPVRAGPALRSPPAPCLRALAGPSSSVRGSSHVSPPPVSVPARPWGKARVGLARHGPGRNPVEVGGLSQGCIDPTARSAPRSRARCSPGACPRGWCPSAANTRPQEPSPCPWPAGSMPTHPARWPMASARSAARYGCPTTSRYPACH